MNAYPKTIDNGLGERLTFLGHTVKDNIEYLEVENFLGPGAGPPMHVHYKQDESLTVIEGKIGIAVLGEEPYYRNAGETIHFRKGVMHRFWNAGDTPLKCKGEIWPAYNIEYFLTELYKSTKQNGRPSTFDAAYLLNRYRSEFGMHGLPGIVKNVVFPVAHFLGKLVRRHKKFAGAPPPVK